MIGSRPASTVIRVNIVVPGFIRTALDDRLFADSAAVGWGHRPWYVARL